MPQGVRSATNRPKKLLSTGRLYAQQTRQQLRNQLQQQTFCFCQFAGRQKQDEKESQPMLLPQPRVSKVVLGLLLHGGSGRDRTVGFQCCRHIERIIRLAIQPNSTRHQRQPARWHGCRERGGDTITYFEVNLCLSIVVRSDFMFFTEVRGECMWKKEGTVYIYIYLHGPDRL